MKTPILLTSFCLGMAAALPAAEITHQAETGFNASTGARMSLGGPRNRSVSEQHSRFQYVFSYAVPDRPIVRLGVNYDRFDFSGGGIIPDTLHALNLVAGLDLKISDVLIRIETQPGYYGDSRGFGSDNFNIPIVIGASYLVSKDFQWIGGLYINPHASYPVLGGLGFRWKTSDRWVLNIVPPNPRVEFLLNDDVTLYAGGQILSSTYRVGDIVGGRRTSRYRNAWVDYTEIRAGAGASWKFSPRGTLDLELGCMAFRQFDYHRIGDDYQNRTGAFYGQVGLKVNF